MIRLFLVFILCMTISFSAKAEMKYYPDPVYKKLNDLDTHPMDDILALAKEGDVRAQFIMGDLYAKGKGGMPKDWKESRFWFEESAIHGYGYSYLRLAALALHEKKNVDAWKWYTLAIRVLEDADQKFAVRSRDEISDKLSPDELKQAKKAANEWEDIQSARLKAEKQRKKEEEAKAKQLEEFSSKSAVEKKSDEQSHETKSMTSQPRNKGVRLNE